jgi:uncharacterized protein
MSHKVRLPATTLCILLVAAACSPGLAPATADGPAALPNPASVYCEGQGGRLEIRSDASGGQWGTCLFSDGSECEEWAFYRQECMPGQSLTQAPAATAATAVPEGWLTYTHNGLGYSFAYPSGSTIETDNVDRFVSVIGPLVNDGHWPWFGVSHPEEGDYHLPDGADLETWLRDHNRLPAKVVDTRMIAGETALHIRQNNGPQACDDDLYFFAHASRIYEITIIHTATEDWKVYDIFLDSFRFE